MEPVPEVAKLTIDPETAFLDIADTVRLVATAHDAGNVVIDDPDLEWQTGSGSLSVDATGLVTAVEPGDGVVEAVAPSGVAASARITVSPITGLQPDAGRYGQVVRISGVDLSPQATVYFSGAGGGRVPAFTRSATADALEVWVPVGAVDGPLELDWPGNSVTTNQSFDLTAPEDIYAGRAGPADLPFPYENPSLLATSGAPHAFRFTTTADGPFSLHLADRGERGVRTAVRAWLFRVDRAPSH